MIIIDEEINMEYSEILTPSELGVLKASGRIKFCNRCEKHGVFNHRAANKLGYICRICERLAWADRKARKEIPVKRASNICSVCKTNETYIIEDNKTFCASCYDAQSTLAFCEIHSGSLPELDSDSQRHIILEAALAKERNRRKATI